MLLGKHSTFSYTDMVFKNKQHNFYWMTHSTMESLINDKCHTAQLYFTKMLALVVVKTRLTGEVKKSRHVPFR